MTLTIPKQTIRAYRKKRHHNHFVRTIVSENW
jgi:hypothetical protein